MSRKVLAPLGLTLFVLLVLVACGRAGPDPTAVDKAVEATLTARASRSESTAALTLDATVEALLTREAAPTTTEMLSPDASTAGVGVGEALPPGESDPTQTPAPTVAPATWQQYVNPAGTFSLSYPDTWKMASQLANRVTFSFLPNGVANIDIINPADAAASLRAAFDSVDGIAGYAMADQAGRYVIGAIEKGAWSVEPPGYYALLDVNDYGLPVQWLYVAIRRDESHAALAKVALANGKLTQEQRETLGQILASVRPAGVATPAPSAEATATPAQPQPTAPQPAQTQAAQPPPTQVQPTPAAQPLPTQTPPAQTAPARTPQVTTDQSVNLRSGPGTTYMVKAVTQPGQKYDLVGRNQEETWYQVCCVAGEKLWLSKIVAIVSGDATSIPVVTAPGVEATPTKGP